MVPTPLVPFPSADTRMGGMLPFLCTCFRASRGLRSRRLHQRLFCDAIQLHRAREVPWSLRSRQHRTFTLCSAAQLEAAPASPTKTDYDVQQIQVLEGLDPVRKRPGMYIGSTGQRGLHHLVFEILDNAIDEVQGGHARLVQVELDVATGWVTVTDDGRGIPTDIHPSTGKSAVETVLTVLHAGGKFGGEGSGYQVSGGLHGVGISVVNALSQELHVTVWRQGKKHEQSYAHGRPLSDLKSSRLPKQEAAKTGTQVSFRYDPVVFEKGITFDANAIRSRLRELAFLNSAVTILFRVTGVRSSNGNNTGEPEGEWETLHFGGGLGEYVAFLNRDKQTLHQPITASRKVDGVTVDVALQWCSDSFSETMVGFVNSVKTIDGGTHMDGFKAALTRLVNNLARKTKALKEGDANLFGEHVREGLGAIVSVKVPDPEFEGQTKTRLGNPEVRKIVESVVSQVVGEALEMDTTTFNLVFSKGLQAFKAAEAAKKARELVRRKSVLTKSTLPGKLADCTTTNREESEIFIVEGDSAGGSAKQARDRRFQAILPLRGKILNVEKQDDSTMYKNSQIADLIVALGLGVKGDDIQGLRYGKVILLTDADVDGAHIRTLLLTFLFRYQQSLFANGRIYVGCPPLYRLEMGKKSMYLHDEQALQEALKGRTSGYTMQRFKGLGEMMPEQLWQTTLNPENRRLKRLTLEDAAEASHLFTLLMGDRVEPRRNLIEAHGSRLQLQDLDI